MKFNTSTLMLCRAVEAGESWEMKPAAPKPSGFASFLGNLFSTVSKEASPLLKFAAEHGLPAPLDKQIEALQNKINELSNLKYRANSAYSVAVERLLARKNEPQAAIVQQEHRGQIIQADSAIALLHKAINAGATARKAVLSGGNVRDTGARFGAAYSKGMSSFTKSQRGLNAFNSRTQALASPTARESTAIGYAQTAGQIIGGTLYETAAKTGTALEKVGVGTIRAINTSTGLIQYLPYMAVGLGGLYVLTLLPRPRQNPRTRRSPASSRVIAQFAPYAALGALALLAAARGVASTGPYPTKSVDAKGVN